MKSLSYLILAVILAVSCNFRKKGSETPAESDATKSSHVVTVSEVIQTSSYTYLKLKEGETEYWAAVSAIDAKEGQTFYYNQSMEMKDFKSRELKRTFPSILFIETLSPTPIEAKKPEALTTKGRQIMNRVENISIEPAEGGITIAELMSNKSKYEGRQTKIRGKVVKFFPDIMKKNWVHIQDGTEASGEYDLVVTTDDMVNEGDEVTFEGKVALNKDFGYGYKYDILLEEARVLNAGLSK